MKKEVNQHLATIRNFKILKTAEEVAISVLKRVEELKKEKFSEKQLKDTTARLKKDFIAGKDLDDLIVEAFACAHYAIELTYGITLYKVQIMGGYALHKGDVAEMKTGEGKTLTAILPTYLNALSGKGVHVITVNEYLSSRDALNVGKVFSKLGISVGDVTKDQKPEEKRIAYHKDITYITNSEVGFDYLKDYMVQYPTSKVQRRRFNYAIIDEVDSILIDEARTPLIIAGGEQIDEGEYENADEFVQTLILDRDFEIDMETKQAYLTYDGARKAETHYHFKNLYSYENSKTVHRIHNALQANNIFHFDVDYTVKDDKVVLIDIFTGRLLEGRTFSEGLHQAIEAKEHTKINPENKTFAAITYQNLFRMYDKLAGMSGTAFSEEEELLNIYNMRVIEIPTNMPMIREDKPDLIFSTMDAKFNAVVEKIEKIHATGQPLLVGTKSVSDSQKLSDMLLEVGIDHEVLNAKNHAREADIIMNSGQKNAITISTNMAGRGTDIQLGDGVTDLGGLFVIGTERHESQRIDNQLRGRSGRQGDPGISQFIVSLDDEIMIRTGMKRVQKFMKSLDETPIESKMIQRSLTIAQKRIEGINFDARKSIVEYDDVLNRQRLICYKQRDAILYTHEMMPIFKKVLEAFVKNKIDSEEAFTNSIFDSTKLIAYLNEEFTLEEKNKIVTAEINNVAAQKYLYDELYKYFTNKYHEADQEKVEAYIKRIMLGVLDYNWQNHLDLVQKLKSGIRYRQYAQKNPVQAYVFEADKLFTNFRKEIIDQTIMLVLNTNTKKPTEELFVTKPRATNDLVVN